MGMKHETPNNKVSFNLRQIATKHKDDFVGTGGVVLSAMATDAADEIDRLEQELSNFKNVKSIGCFALETLMPAHDGGLSLTHNAHICYRRVTSREQNTVIGGIMSGIYKGEYFEDANLVAECIRTNEVWKLKWTPPASHKEHIICGPTLEYVLHRADQINRECEELCSQTDDQAHS